MGCQRAKLCARIKPTALCSAFDKENSIEFPLDSVHYLYMKSNPNPSFCPTLPYESLSSCASINEKIKENKIKRKTIIRKIKEMKMKRNININLAILPSHDTTPLLSFLVLRKFPITHNMGQLCCPSLFCLLLSTL